jgi:2-methylisocitrate lyase-like PEP mutase family enzyme
MTTPSNSSASLSAKAEEFLRLHRAPEILQVVNVWDAISAKTIAEVPGTRALATAGHSIASSLGYQDGTVPLDLMIDAISRIASATELPVSADLDGGYGNAGETVRRAIGVGIIGANIEDRMEPLADSVAKMEAAVKAGEAEGIPFVLNARTDAFVRGANRDPKEVLVDAIERGRAYLEVGASTVFVPGLFDEDTVRALVEGIGHNRLSVIGVPGSLPPARLQELGVARISYGPFTQRVALTALADTAAALLKGGVLPEGIRALN